MRRPAVTSAVAVAVSVLLVGACSGDESERPKSSATSTVGTMPVADYAAARAAIPLEGVPGRPLYWDNVDLGESPKVEELVSIVRHWVALDHVLTYTDAPQRWEDVEYMRLFATEEHREWSESRYRSDLEYNPDPWLGPQWIRMLGVDAEARPATVTLCFDHGYYGRESEGGGSEMFRDIRELLVVYRLVREDVPGAGLRWKVDHERWYAGDDYPESGTDLESECKEWADHELTDVPSDGP